MVKSEDIAAVFDHWRKIMGHERSRMDTARQTVIRKRLSDGYTVEDLMLAIEGCAASAFHMGENERGQRYDSLTLILRDADHVDKFIRAAEAAHRILAERAQERAHEVERMAQRTPEQIEAARKLLASVKLRKIA